MASRQVILERGAQLGRYSIVRELGRGGMGVVYLAHDDNLERQVALKTTQVASIGSSEEMRNQRRHRFIREVMALAQLSHENVVHVYDAGEADHPQLGWILYYTMQFVEGITLAELVVQRGALEPGIAAAICSQIASGLGAGHSRGIVHRDVKPANVFLSQEGRALIGDFGIAKLADATQITRQDQMVGTPNFLAPEQILGGEVTAATDIFALGALFYMITMKRPLRTRVDAASLLEHARGNAARGKMLSALTVPRALRNVVACALEQEPSQRYPDGHAFAEALSDFATRIPSLREECEPNDETGQSTFRVQFKTIDTDTFTSPLHEVEKRTPSSPAHVDFPASDERGQKSCDGGTTTASSASPLSSRRSMQSTTQKRAQTESTAVFNMRSLSLPEEMDFSGMEEELPSLKPLGVTDEKKNVLLPRGTTESEELYHLRSALRFLENLVAQAPEVPVYLRMPMPTRDTELISTSAPDAAGASSPHPSSGGMMPERPIATVERVQGKIPSSSIHQRVAAPGQISGNSNSSLVENATSPSRNRAQQETVELTVPLTSTSPVQSLEIVGTADAGSADASLGLFSRVAAIWRPKKN